VCSKIHVPASSAVMFLALESLITWNCRKEINSPWVCAESDSSSGAWVKFPQTSRPPWRQKVVCQSTRGMENDKVRRCTLIHMLALPAQLRNNFCRSFREKKRSRTKDREHQLIVEGRVGTQWYHKRLLDSFVQYLSSRRRERLTWLWPIRE
jgi:hypothetical protein